MPEITQRPFAGFDSAKPLPLLVASMWGFPLDHIEDDGDHLFSILDWIAGITKDDPIKIWKGLQPLISDNEGDILVVKVFRTTPDGKTSLHEFADDNGIYFITWNLHPKAFHSNLVSIREFLAEAGVFVASTNSSTSKSHEMQKLSKRRVFVSYARSDADFVDKLCQQLEERSIRTWMDRNEIKPGDIWDDKVDEALRQCGAMILILSPASVRSENVDKEWKFLMGTLNRPIIPILWQDCTPHFQLVNLQYIDFRNHREGAIDELVAA